VLLLNNLERQDNVVSRFLDLPLHLHLSAMAHNQ
jgi:hypothetical protein